MISPNLQMSLQQATNSLFWNMTMMRKKDLDDKDAEPILLEVLDLTEKVKSVKKDE